MGSKDSKKNYYGPWKGILSTSWIGYDHNKWLDTTVVSYYIDNILYTVVRSIDPDPEFWIRLVTSNNSSIQVMLDQ